MRTTLHRLSARSVATLARAGRHADGGGLYLDITPRGTKSFSFIFRMNGRRHEMGLGGINSVTLARARERAADYRAKIADGINPRDGKPVSKPTATFGEVADRYIADHEPGWKNAAHVAQWRQLKDQAAHLWGRECRVINTEDVLTVLRPMWQEKAETARRVRGRIESILDAAKARGFREGENPATWRGNLDQVLPRTRKLQRGHHAAMPYADVPAFYTKLCTMTGATAVALRFLILTAARSGEVREAPWSEVGEDLWTVPAVRMKAGREHRVPLAAAALGVLEEARDVALRESPLLFPSLGGKPLSEMAFNMLLRRCELPYTAHGFRSSFRDWVAEETAYPGDLAELALAHQVGDETERAYRRGDGLDKRRQLASEWARFVASASGAPASTAASEA